MRIGGALVSAVAIMPSLAVAAGQFHLPPSGPWVVDYADNSCRLIRHFGEGRDKALLAFESEAPGAIDMLVANRRLPTSFEAVRAKFVPGQTMPMLGRAAETAGHDPLVLWPIVNLISDEDLKELRKLVEAREGPVPRGWFELNSTELAAMKARRKSFAASVTSVQIELGPKTALVLETGSLGEPIAMFDKCSRDSLRDWGVDPDLEDKIVRHVVAIHPEKWIQSEDYPTDQAWLRQESIVKVRVLVDAEGRPTKCVALSHFTQTSFNRVVCDKIIERGRFEPAELADGTKVPSYYVREFSFRVRL